MLAEISVVPSDHWDHLSPDVAETVRLIKSSGLHYQLGAMGTTVEGDPDEVFELIKRLHMNMRRHSHRIATSINIDDDIRRPTGRLQGKIKAVEEKL